MSAQIKAITNSRGDTFQIMDWAHMGNPSGPLARIIHMSIWKYDMWLPDKRGDIHIEKQYFETGLCGLCLEGDGGQGGCNLESMFPCSNPPQWGWCHVCKEYAYFDMEG